MSSLFSSITLFMRHSDIISSMASKISSLPIVPVPPSKGSTLTCSTGYSVGVSRPWDAQPHIFMARGLAAFSRMFVQFFISALLAPSMQGRRLSVSPASSLSSFCSNMSKNYPKSTQGGLLAQRIALPELISCPAKSRT